MIRQTDIAAFILSCAREVTRGSMRNILSYTKRLHEFLRDTGRLDIPFEGLFAVSVFRETKIQQPLSTDELNRILEQLDLTKAKGKRNLTIILLLYAQFIRKCRCSMCYGHTKWFGLCSLPTSE